MQPSSRDGSALLFKWCVASTRDDHPMYNSGERIDKALGFTARRRHRMEGRTVGGPRTGECCRYRNLRLNFSCSDSASVRLDSSRKEAAILVRVDSTDLAEMCSSGFTACA